MAGPNQTVNDVQYRHSKTFDRYEPRLGDRLVREPGTRTYGDARRLEHENALKHNTVIGRDPDTYRGNRQDPISERNAKKYYPEGGYKKPCRK